MKVNRFLLKKEMELSHQQPQALVALAGNHILKLNDICNIVDPVYLRVRIGSIRIRYCDLKCVKLEPLAT